MQRLTELDNMLAGLLSNEDLLGAAICSGKADILSFQMPVEYDGEVLEETIYTLVTAVKTVKDLGFRADTMDILFDKARVVARETNDVYTVMLVEPRVKADTLESALHTAEHKLSTMIGFPAPNEERFTDQPDNKVKPSLEQQYLQDGVESEDVLIFGEETTFGESLQEKLNEEDVLLFNRRSDS